VLSDCRGMNGDMEDFEIVLRGTVAAERSSRSWKCFCITLASDFRGTRKLQFRSRVYHYTYHIHKLLDSYPLLEGEVSLEGHL
jgi:hypothetical protein